MAETETTDDRVKDRLGGWQDSETRKHIYQDRETQELRAEGANVRHVCGSAQVHRPRVPSLTSQMVVRRWIWTPFSRCFRTRRS